MPAKIKYPDVNGINKYDYYNIKYNNAYPQKYNEYYKKPYFNSPFHKKY